MKVYTVKNENSNVIYIIIVGISATISITLLIPTAYAQTENENDTNSSDTLYNEMLNPRQIEYPAIKGFNDLHIEAINHINPNNTATNNKSVLDLIVHHHCKVYDDMTAACLLFPTGMGDQDKPYGFEYVITSEQYNELPTEEKKFWHYHLNELPKVNAKLPDMTEEEAMAAKPILDETYGKIVYFWQYGDKYPIGEPKVVIIEELTG